MSASLVVICEGGNNNGKLKKISHTRATTSQSFVTIFERRIFRAKLNWSVTKSGLGVVKKR